MNYLHHPNLLTQFWASVNCEFNKLLSDFVRRDGWLFQDLGVLAKKANIASIFRCCSATLNNPALGKIERLDHFIRVITVILDAAKTQWLAPWRNYVVDPSKGVIPPFLKRQVGGFFLVYMLYQNQPLPSRYQRRQRILMDSRDLVAMHVFNATMQRLPKSDDQLKELGRQIVILFNDLVKSEAFEFSAFNDVFITPSSSIRHLLSTKFCPFTKILFSLKDLHDQLHFLTYHESVKVFQSLISYRKYLKPPKTVKKEVEKSSSKSEPGLPNPTRNKGDFPPVDKEWSVEEIKALENENDLGKIAHCLPSILKSLSLGPALTRKRFTGHDEKVLDREINYCIDSFKLCKRRLDKTNRRRRKKESRSRQDDQKPIAHIVWREYLTDNQAWIDKVLQGQHKSTPTVKVELVGGGAENQFLNATQPLADSFVRADGDDADEWETEEEEGLDEDEKAAPVILEWDTSQKEPKTPPNKKLKVPMHMPSI